jgi:hypothetical protein
MVRVSGVVMEARAVVAGPKPVGIKAVSVVSSSRSIRRPSSRINRFAVYTPLFVIERVAVTPPVVVLAHDHWPGAKPVTSLVKRIDVR